MILSNIGFVFDLEGTLVDIELVHQKTWEIIAEKFGVKFGIQEFLHFAGAGDQAIANEIVHLLCTNKITSEELRRDKACLYKEILYSIDLCPREGVITYINRAFECSSDLVIASLTPNEYILTKSGLRSFFTHVLTEESVIYKKPDPEVYLKAKKLLNKAKILVHEDSPVGVASAKKAGLIVVAFPIFEEIRFNPKPDMIFPSWVGLDPMMIIEKNKYLFC